MKYTSHDLFQLGVKNSEPFIEWLNLYSDKFDINTPDRIIAFLSNLFHESGNFVYVEELASGDAYDTRVDLGNTPERDGDGRKYKGRGLGQITGKANYDLFTSWCKLNGIKSPDFVKEPEKLKEPQWAVLSAFWFWEENRLTLYADKRLFKEVASIWNTGKPDSQQINGWKERTEKAKVIETWLKKLIAG